MHFVLSIFISVVNIVPKMSYISWFVYASVVI